jgi:hypothetical protein
MCVGEVYLFLDLVITGLNLAVASFSLTASRVEPQFRTSIYIRAASGTAFTTIHRIAFRIQIWNRPFRRIAIGGAGGRGRLTEITDQKQEN